MHLTNRLILAAALVAMALPATAQRATVGILQFKNAAGVDIRVANALADMLTTELVKTGKFEVVERTALAQIADEQNLGASGAVDPATAARIGKLKGADYMLFGTVTEYGQKGSSGGAGFLPGPLGRVRLGGNKVSLAIDVRFTDTTSGSIVFADTYREEDKASNIDIGLFDVDQGNATGGEMGRAVVSAITERIILATYPPKIAMYTQATGEVILNYGSGTFEDVEAWDVYRAGQEIVDPDTGMSLGSRDTVVGRIAVTRSEEKMTYGRLVSGQAVVGDACKPAEGSVRRTSSRDSEPEPEKEEAAKEDDGGEKKGGFFNRMKNKMKNE